MKTQEANWKWSAVKVAEFLAKKNIQAATAGKPCPVAQRVLERVEATIQG